MLDDTLVIWGGEFGRTVYSQGKLTADDYGRDHHPRCFTMWMAGGGIKPGMTIGETDDFSYNIVRDPVHVHDLNATILHCLGIDHTRLTYKFQGRYFRLTDVHGECREANFGLAEQKQTMTGASRAWIQRSNNDRTKKHSEGRWRGAHDLTFYRPRQRRE